MPRINVVKTRYNSTIMLQRSVPLKIVVANRPVQHRLQHVALNIADNYFAK